ncbi:MAG: PaaI family thioesterase [Coriobacteriaceae bacterium]|nr:PaaI family thioesterase [Coriobacteriaceae bacterium]
MDIIEYLGTKVVELTPDKLAIETPVTEDICNVHGILHGGITAFLAEHAASELTTLNASKDEIIGLGLQLDVTHLESAKAGDVVRTVATPIRYGGRIRVIRVEQFRLSDGKMTTTSQLTTYLKRPHK